LTGCRSKYYVIKVGAVLNLRSRWKKGMALHVDLVESPTSVPAGGFRRQMLAILEAVGSSASLGLACLRALRRPRIYLPLTFAQVWVATVGTRADVAFGRVSDLLSPDHVASLEAGAKSLGHSVDEVTALTVALRATAAGVRRRVSDTRLDSGATDLARTTRTLTGTSAELRAASVSLRSILGKIDQGHSSLGQAVNDPTLYHALLTAAAQVDEAALGAAAFVRDVHARPERYIRVSLF
jgi:hypothetical protein